MQVKSGIQKAIYEIAVQLELLEVLTHQDENWGAKHWALLELQAELEFRTYN